MVVESVQHSGRASGRVEGGLPAGGIGGASVPGRGGNLKELGPVLELRGVLRRGARLFDFRFQISH